MQDQTPRDLIEKFYADYDLGTDGGQNSSSVKIVLTKKIHFYFPNFDARRKAVVKHDMHHLLTGYSAGTIIGESEISAWEVASGCKKYWPVFLIDTSGMMLGLVINPIRILKAFSRGRKTRNLYHDLMPDEQALDTPVSELKSLLALDHYPINTSPSFTDALLFGLFLIFGAVYSLASFVLLPLIIFYSIYIEQIRKPEQHGKN